MVPSRILILDDEQVVCDGCQMVLSEKGYTVDIEMEGRTGLNAFLGDEYDLMLLDMKLPDLDGMDILRTIRKEKANSYVIVMTGYSTVQNAVEAMKLGAFDYLSKPFTDDELLFSVERALERKSLVEENISLRKELMDRFGYDNIIGQNPKILEIFNQVEKVAPTDSTVVIYGESGTGKELFAGAIHAHSARAAQKFIAVDCNTLSSTLLESELFGHVKGAFTGAFNDKAGLFEIAHRGTLFMDDVTNLTMETQGKLLRVLEAREYKPVGSSRFKNTDVRIIAATNKDLRAMVDEGTFREDLFYRLNVFPIFLPPLRERKDDIPLLVYHFLRQFCQKIGKNIKGFTDDALETLVDYHWPGNIRQLRNVVERLVIMFEGGTMDLSDIYGQLQTKRSWGGDAIPDTVEQLNVIKKRLIAEGYSQIQKAFLIKALKLCNGNITHAAEKVGMKRSNFHNLMRKYKLKGNTFKKEEQ